MSRRDEAAFGQKAWHRFCDELKRAGDIVLREETPEDELTRAEGYRHLVRMIRAGFEATCEFANPRHPKMVPMATRTMVYEGVTPDARYHHAFIDGALDYRICGQRGTAPFIEFSVYTGQSALHSTYEMVGSMTEEELEVAGDGTYELVLSPDEQPGNWIRCNPETKRLFVRQYAHDWSVTESASYEIECLDANGPPPPLDLEQLSEGLARTASFVAAEPPFWAAISEYWKGHAVNQIVPQETADSSTDITVPIGHRFACGYFEIAADEALEITFTPVDVPYWGLGLANYWYEPLHWPETRSSVNSGSASAEPGGKVRVIVSDHPPGGGENWLDTDGHREGTLVFRWSRTTEPVPEFTTRIVKVEPVR